MDRSIGGRDRHKAREPIIIIAPVNPGSQGRAAMVILDNNSIARERTNGDSIFEFIFTVRIIEKLQLKKKMKARI